MDTVGIVRLLDGGAPAVEGVGCGGGDGIGGGMVQVEKSSLYGAR